MVLYKKRITKALIRLRDAQAGLHLCCSQTFEDRFSRGEAHMETVSMGLPVLYNFSKGS